MQNNNNHSHVLWMTRTAVLVALLIACQWLTGPTQAFAGQYITGTLVNCVLAVAAIFGGLWSGIAVALLSPFCAFLLGIGPKLLQIVPCIALGNCTFVCVLSLLKMQGKLWQKAVQVLAAAAAKFLVLYIAVVQIVIPVMGDKLKAPQIKTFTAMFSWPQLVTALLGGTLAMLLLPALQKAIKKDY